MLIIRDEQIRQLDEIAEEKFIDDLTLTVRDFHSDQVEDLNDEELRELVKIGAARARSHGLTFEDTIGAFVGWMFEFAPNFDEQENIKKCWRRKVLSRMTGSNLLSKPHRKKIGRKPKQCMTKRLGMTNQSP